MFKKFFNFFKDIITLKVYSNNLSGIYANIILAIRLIIMAITAFKFVLKLPFKNQKINFFCGFSSVFFGILWAII